jgi:voltage-gated potassium channel
VDAPVDELSRRERRRLGARAVLRTVVTTVLLLLVYVLAPVPVGSVTAAGTVVRLVAVVAIVAVVVAVQVRSIVSASHPGVRAVEALVTAIAVFLVLFALLYLGLAGADPATFNEPLDRVGALYFAVTVLATVGFGDITAETAGARLVVTVQMLVGLGLIAVIVRVFTAAAQVGATRRGAERRAGHRGDRRRARRPERRRVGRPAGSDGVRDDAGRGARGGPAGRADGTGAA